MLNEPRGTLRLRVLLLMAERRGKPLSDTEVEAWVDAEFDRMTKPRRTIIDDTLAVSP